MVSRAWRLPDGIPAADVKNLASALEVPDLLARCLLGRGLTDPDRAASFLAPTLSQLHDPGLFHGLDRACERIRQAVEKGEKVLIHGDYDADGLTATTLLLDLFDQLGAPAAWHIPNRLTEGFSFSPRVMARVRDEGFTLCITVDNGITAVAEVAELKALGCDVIVTDHHEPGPELPAAYAILDPKLPDSGYPFAGLAGVGVAFKLAWGVARTFTGARTVAPEFRDFLLRALELVTVGTVADVVPLVDENRVLVAHGLRTLHRPANLGLAALKRVCRLGEREIGPLDIAFRLAPRINAAGRMGRTELALELLRATDTDHADARAAALDQANGERQRVEKGVLDESRRLLAENHELAEAPVLVLASRGWSPGVVGIVAARLCDEFNRPALMIAVEDGTGRGSARAPEGFPIHRAFQAADDLLISHGGHARAAGLKVAEERIPELRRRLVQVAGELDCPPPPLHLDGEARLEQITPHLVAGLKRLGPHGADNPPPLFAALDTVVAGHAWNSGYGGRDLSFLVRQGEQVRTAVYREGARKLGGRITRGQRLSLAFTPAMSWKGDDVELKVKAIRTEEESAERGAEA